MSGQYQRREQTQAGAALMLLIVEKQQWRLEATADQRPGKSVVVTIERLRYRHRIAPIEHPCHRIEHGLLVPSAIELPEAEHHQRGHCRSDERRVGQEGVSTGRSRWSP